MNNSGEISKWTVVTIATISIAIVFLLFYNLLIKDSISSFTGSESVKIEEKCVDCHKPSKDMSPHHSYEKIGCISCHKGNPDEEDITAAHTNMISIPGNLADARESCGSTACHPGITERIESSLMTSMSGVVNIQRYFFGESDTLNAHVHVKDLTYSSADSYTRNLCASCHLGREKRSLGPVTEKSRGGACLACHLNYSDQAKSELADWTKGDPMHFHPSLSLNITNDHCFGCHSRSGRISTSYEGWHESQLKEIPGNNPQEYRLLDDGRVFVKIEEDIHHKLGLDCIDCHSANEVMGDGQKYYHAEDAVKIRCQDCHIKNDPETLVYNDLDYESQKIVGLRDHLNEEMTFVIGSVSNEALVNVIVEDDQYFMISKNRGKKFQLSPQNEACSKGSAHDDLSCSTCHSGWTPQCIQCHVSYDQEIKGFDLLARERTQGKWIEKGGHFLAELPTLGIMEGEGAKRNITTFVPGMILNAETRGYPLAEDTSEKFARLFAPIEAHTTVKTARDCESCHKDPNTIGYGRGKLKFDPSNKKWSFNPLYPLKKEDGLPEDAWIALFEDNVKTRATRSNGRPFNTKEQNRILIVGLCLDCHKGNSAIMEKSLFDFEKQLEVARNSKDCKFE